MLQESTVFWQEKLVFLAPGFTLPSGPKSIMIAIIFNDQINNEQATNWKY